MGHIREKGGRGFIEVVLLEKGRIREEGLLERGLLEKGCLEMGTFIERGS
jgi:hypothetical protein